MDNNKSNICDISSSSSSNNCCGCLPLPLPLAVGRADCHDLKATSSGNNSSTTQQWQQTELANTLWSRTFSRDFEMRFYTDSMRVQWMVVPACVSQPSTAIVAPAAVWKGVVVAQVDAAFSVAIVATVAAVAVAALCQVPATGHVNTAGGNFEAQLKNMFTLALSHGRRSFVCFLQWLAYWPKDHCVISQSWKRKWVHREKQSQPRKIQRVGATNVNEALLSLQDRENV